MARSILVTGGAGYIGSHMVKMLAQSGFKAVVFDNLLTGHQDAIGKAAFVKGDLREPEAIAELMRQRRFDAVMHFAASCYVGESVQNPSKYYVNNVLGSLNLLEAMRGSETRHLVFSSSCSTYGLPLTDLMTEEHPQQPVNPYGASKLMAERMMKDYGRAYGIRTVALRYFNAAGCDPDGELGELHDPETHLVPLVLREALRVRAGGDPAQTRLEVFGTDFDTLDGTCVRDYVHIADLCSAHLLALGRFSPSAAAFEAFNLGSGRGNSVLEVIETCRKVTGQVISYRSAPRRAGDPARLVACAQHAKEVLGWKPRYPDLAEIVATAWQWFSRTENAARGAHARAMGAPRA